MKTIGNKDLVTKGMLGEAVDAILEGMNKMFGDLRTAMNTRFNKVENRLDNVENMLGNVENRLERVEAEVSQVDDDINGLKAEFSGNVSRKEFNEFKSKVGKHYSLTS